MHKYIFLLFLSFSTTSFAYDFMVDSLFYNIVDNEMWDLDYPTVELTYDNTVLDRVWDGDKYVYFYYDNTHTSVVVPDTVRYDGVLYHVIGIGRGAFQYYKFLSSVSLPETILYLDDGCFSQKRNLGSIVLPNSLTTIGEWAFMECNRLKSVYIPESVTYIGRGAFEECALLESVTLSPGIEVIYNGTFFHCMKLETVNIPEGVIRIDDSAFSLCPMLTSIHLPNSLREIGVSAFGVCTHLSDINFPSELRNMEAFSFFLTPIMKFKSPTAMSVIRERCFYQASLESVTITPNIKSIERSAFEYNENLETVRIEGGVEQIDVDAFASCFHLKDFYCLTDAVPQADNLAFASYKYVIGGTGNTLRIELISPTGIAEQATLHVHKSLLNRFKNTYPWSEFKSIVAIEDETAIGPIAIDEESSSTRRVYDLVGRLRRAAQPGLNVIVGGDGRSRKVMVK
ncbi:MAG: leucine-rich repeat domain-containing protein [Bacteroidaceae bacterium]|nr:leucine-rich repeat domain-containing protein [Bacteroidaceae bacterium]